jgi:hypothetical protein
MKTQKANSGNTLPGDQKAAALSDISIFIVYFSSKSRKYPRRKLFCSENLRIAA